ncbi:MULTISPECIES: HEAT repeat domain-containing protein [Cyanophyceae]|uniref:HEAT repeat domain-containing protein n=1 Tax=Cyanophyceae TaxID=3028117 RepID=UPI0016895CC1|nr:HEAT repeat domain-containing protein [Trichocoleus sp. FACHB-69]MBD1930295.1 HEAT repeat domain-containing protein [Trichocoleus sp. FACHB-69]
MAAASIAEFSQCSLVYEILLEITFLGFGIFDSKNKKWITFPTVAEEAKAVLRETHRQLAISVLKCLLNTIACDELRLEIALYLGDNFLVDQEIIELIIQLMSPFGQQISRRRGKDIRQNARCKFMKIAIENPKVIAIMIHIIKTSQNNKNKQIYSSLLYEIGNEETEGTVLLKRWMHKSADEKIKFLLSDILQKIQVNKSRTICTYRIKPKTPEEVANLVHEAKDEKDEEICCIAIRELSYDRRNPDAIKKTLTAILYSTKNEQFRYHAASSLQFIEPDNPLATSTLTELIYTTQSPTIVKSVIDDLSIEENFQLFIYALAKLIRISKSSNEIDICIVENIFEYQIGVGNPDLIDALTEKLRSSEDEALRSSVAFGLAAANPGNPEAFHTLISILLTTQDDHLFESLIMGIWELYQENDEQMIFLTELLHKSQNEVTRWRLAAILIRYQPSLVESVTILIETFNKTKDKNINFAIRENIPEYGDSEWIDSLVYLLCNSQDSIICEDAAPHLKRILISSKFPSVVAALRNCNQEHNKENGHDCSLYCEGILWHCAQNMSYADFYEAWHRPSTTTHPEAPDNIPVGNSPDAQILEAQNLDFNELQPTDYTYPLAVNLLSLKGETEQGAIAQKLCNKIYKHHAVKIPGKPPTVTSDAELQQHLFEIQDKLQRPNLALVLYIKDTNGFHEPTEEAIAFCQKLADADLGIHIAWITNQSIEQPLKDIQPNPPKLINKIQSWIDEIV